MRLDKFLKNSRIIKRRTIAKEACDGGRVTVNGRTAKAGTNVDVGDTIEIAFGSGNLKVEVTRVIESPKKEEATDMYTVVS